MTSKNAFLSVLAIGAHPDDIEIGAGGTVAKLVADGHRVAACILADESDPSAADLRRHETSVALTSLGIRASDILFLGMKDAHIRADGVSVADLRNRLHEHHFDPALVLCHTQNDSHNDHVEASKLASATFRKCTFLHYPVVNSLIKNIFKPAVYVDTTAFWKQKLRALKMHKSQAALSRIRMEDLVAFERIAGRNVGSLHAEGFELREQYNANASHILRQLNSNAITHFWGQLLRVDDVKYVYSTPRRFSSVVQDFRDVSSRAELQDLRKVLMPTWTIQELPENSTDIEDYLTKSNLIIEGGPVSNRFTGSYFNHIPTLPYVIDYDVPGFDNIRIVDRLHRKVIKADYQNEASTKPLYVAHDVGVLTFIQSPFNKNCVWIGAMGIHSLATAACVRLLGTGSFLRELSTKIDLPIPRRNSGYQLLISIEAKTGGITPDWTSLREIRKPI